jgi:hypothetical protein
MPPTISLGRNIPKQIEFNPNDLGLSLPVININDVEYLLGEPYILDENVYQNIYQLCGNLFGRIPYIDQIKTSISDNQIDVKFSICQSI